MQNISEYENVEYAGFWVRAFAYLIDCVVIGLPLLVLRGVFWLIRLGFGATVLTKPLLFQYDLTDLLLYAIQSVYFISCTYLTGTTLGKKVLNLCVVGTDEEKPELFTVIYRETVGRFLNGIGLAFGYLLIGIDKEKRGFHDYLCDTRVIYAKKVKTFEEKKFVSVPQLIRPQEASSETMQSQTLWQVPQGNAYVFQPEETNEKNCVQGSGSVLPSDFQMKETNVEATNTEETKTERNDEREEFTDENK